MTEEIIITRAIGGIMTFIGLLGIGMGFQASDCVYDSKCLGMKPLLTFINNIILDNSLIFLFCSAFFIVMFLAGGGLLFAYNPGDEEK